MTTHRSSKIPALLPYQGSKRRLADQLLAVVPAAPRRVVEPFAGSAAVSLALAGRFRATQIRISDAWPPIALLWNAVLDDRATLIARYHEIWTAGLADPRGHYDQVREQFNLAPSAAALLYLLTRCVKNAVRFNASGAFNQSPDLRRKGAAPETVAVRIELAYDLLRGRTVAVAEDFVDAIAQAKQSDLVYLDPPYHGTSQSRDRRYAFGLDRAALIGAVQTLRARNIDTIISFDGRTGEKHYGEPLPAELGLRVFEVDAGRSSQATLLGKDTRTYETVYLSPGLVAPGQWRELSPRAR